MLDRGDAAVLVAPRADFYQQLDRIPASLTSVRAVVTTNSYTDDTLQAELTDLRAALNASGKSSNDVERIVLGHAGQRARLQKFADAVAPEYLDGSYQPTDPPTKPPFPTVSVVEGLPGEFVDYFQGAIAWNDPGVSDKSAARQSWEHLLNRPAEERHYKSVWAAYMLGRSWEAEDPKKARDYYQQVRALAGQGFADTSGLAEASIGREARLALKADEFETALDLYLQQYAAGSPSAGTSLEFAVGQVLDAGPEAFAPLVKNPQERKLITAYLISRHPYAETTTESIRDNTKAWLDAVEKADVTDAESAEQFALAAYQADDMESAIRWVNRAGGSPTAQWLTAKLLLRAGKVDKATEILSQIVNSFPTAASTNPPVTLSDGLFVDETDDDARIYAGRYIRGELGALRLSRREYTQALDLLLRGEFWTDAAYVADHVLTTDELKSYVDANWPAIAVSVDDDKKSLEEKQFEKLTSDVRYLLARRLTRESHIADARAYFPAEWSGTAEQLMQALTGGWDESLPVEQRAKELAAAAFVLRTNGMELMGTEAGPDWHMYDGNFEGSLTVAARTNEEPQLIAASADEVKRNAESKTEPDERFHYRYQAAELAWEAAKLLPNDSVETARLLCTAGSWLKYRDPQAANRFYKALVVRCRKTDIGAKSDTLRWFPELDDEGNLVRPRLELLDLPSAQEIGGGEGLSSYPIPGKRFILMEGDRVRNIVDAVRRLGVSLTVQELYDANPGVTEYTAGREIFIPQPMPPETTIQDPVAVMPDEIRSGALEDYAPAARQLMISGRAK